jgi:hypothetical protein
MSKYESKLFSQWPQYQKRGMPLFVLYKGIFMFTIPFVGAMLLFRIFVFQHFGWKELVGYAIAGLILGVMRGVSVWDKMEHLYADSRKQDKP